MNSSEGKMKGKRFKRKLSYSLDSRQKEMEDVEISFIVGTNSSRKTGKQARKRKERIAWPDVNAQVQEKTIIPGEKIEITPETWTKILQKGKKNSKQRKRNFREKIVPRNKKEYDQEDKTF